MTEPAFSGPGADEPDASIRALPLKDSPLASLKAAITQIHDAANDVIKLPHPLAPAGHIELHFNRKVVADYDNLVKWAQGSQDDIELKICTMLKESSVDVLIDGKPVGITLGSEAMCEMTGCVDPLAAIKSFFGFDDGSSNFPALKALADALAIEASSDPTRARRFSS